MQPHGGNLRWPVKKYLTPWDVITFLERSTPHPYLEIPIYFPTNSIRSSQGALSKNSPFRLNGGLYSRILVPIRTRKGSNPSRVGFPYAMLEFSAVCSNGKGNRRRATFNDTPPMDLLSRLYVGGSKVVRGTRISVPGKTWNMAGFRPPSRELVMLCARGNAGGKIGTDDVETAVLYAKTIHTSLQNTKKQNFYDHILVQPINPTGALKLSNVKTSQFKTKRYTP